MARTRPQGSGGYTGVYIPFPRSNSSDHLRGTIGGLLPATEINLGKLKVLIDDLEKSAHLPGAPEEISKAKAVQADLIRSGTIPAWTKVAESDIACSDDPNKMAVLSKATGEHDVLYIRGHCKAGSDALQSADHKVTLKVDLIVEQMVNFLDTGSKSIIKIFACESGLDSKGWIFTSAAFTQRFADLMHKAGWTKCSFFGYELSLSSFNLGLEHKHAADLVTRASAVRKQFVPQT